MREESRSSSTKDTTLQKVIWWSRLTWKVRSTTSGQRPEAIARVRDQFGMQSSRAHPHVGMWMGPYHTVIPPSFLKSTA